jgi:hypothetical protein
VRPFNGRRSRPLNIVLYIVQCLNIRVKSFYFGFRKNIAFSGMDLQTQVISDPGEASVFKGGAGGYARGHIPVSLLKGHVHAHLNFRFIHDNALKTAVYQTCQYTYTLHGRIRFKHQRPFPTPASLSILKCIGWDGRFFPNSLTTQNYNSITLANGGAHLAPPIDSRNLPSDGDQQLGRQRYFAAPLRRRKHSDSRVRVNTGLGGH